MSIFNRWRLVPLLVYNGIAAMFIVSWLFAPTRVYWDILDKKTFFLLNGSLQHGDAWQLFWAFANVRVFDLLPACCLFFIFGHYILADNRKFLQQRLAEFLLVAFYTVVSLIISKEITEMPRLSPSLELTPSYRLSELVPWVGAKDFANKSFPGDHSMVLFMWTLCVGFYARISHLLATLAASIVFSLPRLVGGAHWLTDDIIGGLAIALITCSWLLYTPMRGLGETVTRWLAAKLLVLMRFDQPPNPTIN